MLEDFPKLDEMAAEIERLKKSHDLLERIYTWHGGYGPRFVLPTSASKATQRKVMECHKALRLPEELHSELNDHFGFDDSE